MASSSGGGGSGAKRKAAEMGSPVAPTAAAGATKSKSGGEVTKKSRSVSARTQPHFYPQLKAIMAHHGHGSVPSDESVAVVSDLVIDFIRNVLSESEKIATHGRPQQQQPTLKVEHVLFALGKNKQMYEKACKIISFRQTQKELKK